MATTITRRLEHATSSEMAKIVALAGTWLSIRMLAIPAGLEVFSIEDALLMLVIVIGVFWMVADIVFPDLLQYLKAASTPVVVKRKGLRYPPLDGARAGYVYLIRASKGYYKIGRSKDPNDRYLTFKLNLPFEVEFEHVIPCRDHIDSETMLHRVFAHRRADNSEFFALTPDDVATIKSIKEM